MPFELTNTPASMQRLMNNTLHEYLDVFVIVYLDNLLIYSKSEQEHIEHVKMVLEKLSQRNLLLKPEKCEFYRKEVEFLGYVVDIDGVRMDVAKIEAVLQWPTPTTIKEVQAFLRFCHLLPLLHQRLLQDHKVTYEAYTQEYCVQVG